MNEKLLNNYKKQQESRILMAKPEELPLLLYEGAIKYCNVAIVSIEKKDWEKAHNNICRVEEIIEYLINTLNMEYNVSKDFLTIYIYILETLVKANVKKDIEILNIAINEIKDLRDIWKKVMNE